jgi:hypothetical protein
MSVLEALTAIRLAKTIPQWKFRPIHMKILKGELEKP